MGKVIAVPDQEAPDQRIRLVYATDADVGGARLGELDRDHIADRQVVGSGGGRVDQQSPLAREPGLPAFIRRMTVSPRCAVGAPVIVPTEWSNSNWPR